ncbi:MAG: ribonuclease D [gamma proteobacterium symbiont of Bathyaustriella thionipta]|nr:ribonuclease D [gamma proteobacterium symbiont of Bathyaustriella thionipta]MCU7950103.1 ribonuclease D [gamma proteobacterium symbiont of Bathyaustriella thionipta]MCU7953482.1 ribonuclease D [gamma proteobacterium symbiont of Bathyaustriella thionipta]MCU7955569.1 ribonuclease D [gamma proteobacterium symbiont of Bathyaustriella thionipta]MCU7967637.1 ribonuclease D [gamma proteobacterium symbiont of Bathyaustriella thionipta]
MQVHFIDTNQKLTNICQQFAQSDFLALDTEFVRQTTYYPILALLQICDGQRIAIIDPLAIKDLTPLMTVLYNKNITKVLHSARQDMEIFYYLKQSVPESLFDTQISAALLGYGEQIGYASLVKQLLNVNLDKSQTRTDWLKRPLSQKQIDYAADDVRYLAQLYPIQKNKLQELGRSDWLEKDFQFLSSTTTYAPSPETIWRKTKGINKLKKQKLAIVKNLAAFREQLALKQNKPRRRVIADDVLIGLSTNPPADLNELQNHQGLSYRFLQHNGPAMLALIQQGLDTPDKDCPKLPVFQKLSQNEEALADCLMAIVHLSANNNHISPQCLCSRKELDALIKGQRDLTVLSGWRNELIGKHLLKFLSGDAQLSYVSGQLLFS